MSLSPIADGPTKGYQDVSRGRVWAQGLIDVVAGGGLDGGRWPKPAIRLDDHTHSLSMFDQDRS
jgi:hypothetical protein